jgi:mlo protein
VSIETIRKHYLSGILGLVVVEMFSFLLELMLLGLISLLLAQCARGISQICVNSSLFSSKFYLCSEKDYEMNEHIMLESSFSSTNATNIPPRGLSSNQCGEVN